MMSFHILINLSVGADLIESSLLLFRRILSLTRRCQMVYFSLWFSSSRKWPRLTQAAQLPWTLSTNISAWIIMASIKLACLHFFSCTFFAKTYKSWCLLSRFALAIFFGDAWKNSAKIETIARSSENFLKQPPSPLPHTFSSRRVPFGQLFILLCGGQNFWIWSRSGQQTQRPLG